MNSLAGAGDLVRLDVHLLVSALAVALVLVRFLIFGGKFGIRRHNAAGR